MDSKNEIITNINKEITNIIDNFCEVLNNLKVKNNGVSEELKEMIHVKRKIFDITESILKIYTFLVKLKYVYHQEEKNMKYVLEERIDIKSMDERFLDLIKDDDEFI